MTTFLPRDPRTSNEAKARVPGLPRKTVGVARRTAPQIFRPSRGQGDRVPAGSDRRRGPAEVLEQARGTDVL